MSVGKETYIKVSAMVLSSDCVGTALPNSLDVRSDGRHGWGTKAHRGALLDENLLNTVSEYQPGTLPWSALSIGKC